MDLLGSILNSMDKPPVISDTQKAMIKKQHEDFKKHKQAETEIFKKFRTKVEDKINTFLKDDLRKEYKFSAMEQVYRSIIYDVCEVANILAYSFGEEGIDKHVVIFKKEHTPSEDHLNALRRGEEWNEDIAQKLQEKRQKYLDQVKEERNINTQKRNFIPNSNYKDKYKHLIGEDAALEAARKTEANTSYGYVPCKNKKDQRSIEQTLADIKKKKRKLQEQSENNVNQ
ncbi:PREDICTED: sperm-associated antigen 7 homolog [Ceratosolen solmsi marchali]|uniref:Sperm-associated antigen 7 homolog n=1 Tax=Ceratosolen solmsi marchali TaxID=326594 RepID=A0AAJ6YQM8_9HYME|nr:PREDICTED: sperm-associated antigen 7 homolog [Ceratosolen solmsi marchali]